MIQDKSEKILGVVNAMFSELTHSSEQADTESFLSFYEDYPDFIHIAGDGTMRDFAGFKKICSEYYDSLKEQEISILTNKTNILDADLVISGWTVNILARFRNGDIMKMNNYSISYLLKKFSGKWKIIHCHESSPPPEIIEKSGSQNEMHK